MRDTIEVIFEKAGNAITSGNNMALARAVNEMIVLARFDHSLIESLSIAADRLAKAKVYLPRAAAAFLHVAKNAQSGSVLKDRAIAGLVNSAGTLSNLGARREAYGYLLENATAGSMLERKAVDGFVRYYVEAHPPHLQAFIIGEIACHVHYLGGLLTRRMEDEFIERAEAFTKASHRIDAYSYAAEHARAGSAFERRVIDNFSKHADGLPTGMQRVAAYRVAATKAKAGSAFERKAAAGFVRHVELLPTAAQRVWALELTFLHASPEALRGPVLAGVLRYADALRTPTRRIRAFRYAVGVAPSDSESEQQAVAGFVRNVEMLPAVAQRIAAYQSVLEDYGSDTPLGRRATAKLEELETASPPAVRHAIAERFV